MNKTQMVGICAFAVSIIGTYIYATVNSPFAVIALLGPVAGLVWAYLSQSDEYQIVRIASLPEVRSIVVTAFRLKVHDKVRISPFSTLTEDKE